MEFRGHGGSYIESVVWNQPGEASSPQYGVDGSMLCSWYIVQDSGLVSRERQCVWWFGTNGMTMTLAEVRALGRVDFLVAATR